jgi:hypothetical protein
VRLGAREAMIVVDGWTGTARAMVPHAP